jgi:6-phosphogluconolactonase
MTELGVVGEAARPGYIVFDPTGKFAYSVGEMQKDGKPVGAVDAWERDPDTGKLTLMNQAESGGAGPCHVTISKDRDWAIVANYGDGSIASLPIWDDGNVGPPACVVKHQGHGPNEKRQAGPHAHSMNFDPSGKYAIACDLGLDRVIVYAFDPDKGTLTKHSEAKAPPGGGPRHLAWSKDGRFAYVSEEMGSAVTVFAWDAAKGTLSEVETVSQLPDGKHVDNNTAAEVLVHPSGKFVYASNRVHDSIAIFRADPSTGKLTMVGTEPTRGKIPRNFGIDPTGKYLIAANQDSGTIVPFRIDGGSGKLTATGEQFAVPMPTGVRFVER